MGKGESSSKHTLDATLQVFTRTETPGTPFTTSEVAEELGCARRTAYGKLEELAQRGELETKKVGARGRVWWRPLDGSGQPESSTGLDQTQFEELVEAVTDYAIFVLDPDGHVQTWNQGARQLKGYEEAEIVGEHVSTFYTEEDREAGRPDENLATAVEEGRVEDEGERVRKDGDTFWANVTITALYDDDELRGFAKVTRDMTDRHEYEQRLRNQRDELEELNQINAVIRDIDQTLVTAQSREEIETAVCERLAASDTFTAAWTAEYTDDYGDIAPRTSAGISEDYLEAIRAGDEDATEGTEKGVGATALQTHSIQPVHELKSDANGEPWRDASLEEGFESAITVPLLYNEVEYGVLTVYASDESGFDQRIIAVMKELGETISHAIAAIRRKERERTLTALQESTRELFHTDSRSGLGDILVRTLTDDLTLADAVVYSFDTTENVLEPVSSSFETGVFTDKLTPLTAGADSPLWTCFMDGETRLAESVIPARGIGRRRTLVVPLGEHGVLAVAVAEQETFDSDVRNLVELVGATAEAAFDRVESQANLRERDELLQQQNQRLQRLNQINTIIREVDQGLVQATTREEVQRVVCDRLTQSDRFRFAWIGTRDDVADGITPQVWNGNGRGYLDSVDVASGSETDESEPAVTALRTGDVTVVSNVADDLRGGSWRKEAFSREFQSVISVPLRYGNVDYGVLTVYADRPDVFDEMEQAVLAELGDTIGNAISAVDTQHALLTDQVVELEFRVPDVSRSFLARVARQIDSEITFEGMIPLSESTARTFFVVHDAVPDDIGDVLERSVAVESHEMVAIGDTEHLVQAVVSGPTIALSLLEHGASLRTLTVTDDGVQLVVDLESGTDVRTFIERFQERYESAEFLARRERERPVRTSDGVYAELEGYLTDRQLEVLKTAYYSGFFDSPRTSTGGDVADQLGVSQPTVTEQLRTAQCKVLELLFDDSPASA